MSRTRGLGIGPGEGFHEITNMSRLRSLGIGLGGYGFHEIAGSSTFIFPNVAGRGCLTVTYI